MRVFDVPWPIVVHLVVALLAVVVGILILIFRKGTPKHKAIGWFWVCLMVIAALTSFSIQARGHFSLIHLLSVVMLVPSCKRNGLA